MIKADENFIRFYFYYLKHFTLFCAFLTLPHPEKSIQIFICVFQKLTGKLKSTLTKIKLRIILYFVYNSVNYLYS